MNHPTVPVHRRPQGRGARDRRRTGAAGQRRPGPGEIVYSNGFALMALARSEGAEVIDLGIVPDTRRRHGRRDPPRARRRRRRAGDHRRRLGRRLRSGAARRWRPRAWTLSFWKVAMRPGRPMMHGRLGAMHVLGLPGNPVSAYVCAFLFLVPLLRRLAGPHRRRAADRIGGARLRPAGKRRARRLPARDARAGPDGAPGRDAVPGAGLRR